MDENPLTPPRHWAAFLAYLSYTIAAGFLCFAGYAILGGGLPLNVALRATVNSITWFCTAKTIPTGHLLRILVVLACDLVVFLLILEDLMGAAGPHD